MKRVIPVFGACPETTEVAPLVKEFQKKSAGSGTVVCTAGQHRKILGQVLQIFDIKPSYDLNIMKQGQDLYDVTVRMLTGVHDALDKAKPDVVLIHGDTTTSTAVVFAAFYQQIPVGHVEMGLHTYNIYSLWPEKMNRQITGRITTYHFSPTALGKRNLLTEGMQEDKITATGGTVIDALHIVVDKVKTDGVLQQKLVGVLGKTGYNTSRLVDSKKLILITGHRRGSFGDGFISMCTATKDLTVKHPYMDLACSMHLNPNVRKPIHEVFGENLNNLGDMLFIEPLEYLSFVFLTKKMTLILTGNGGIQEEAPGLSKPVLVMRDTTERPEALDAGMVKLVGTDYNRIVSEVSILLDDASTHEQMSKVVSPYDGGKACVHIAQTLNVRL